MELTVDGIGVIVLVNEDGKVVGVEVPGHLTPEGIMARMSVIGPKDGNIRRIEFVPATATGAGALRGVK